MTQTTKRKKHNLFDGSFLKMMRERNDLTLDEFARRIDSSKSHLWELENGRKTEPSFALVYKMSVALGCDMKLFARTAR